MLPSAPRPLPQGAPIEAAGRLLPRLAQGAARASLVAQTCSCSAACSPPPSSAVLGGEASSSTSSSSRHRRQQRLPAATSDRAAGAAVLAAGEGEEGQDDGSSSSKREPAGVSAPEGPAASLQAELLERLTRASPRKQWRFRPASPLDPLWGADPLGARPPWDNSPLRIQRTCGLPGSNFSALPGLTRPHVGRAGGPPKPFVWQQGPPEQPLETPAETATVVITMQDGQKLVHPVRRRDTLQAAFLAAAAVGTSAARWSLAPRQARAALLQMPATNLKNRYYLVRAGEGECERDGYVLTNPVFKTSMSSGLSPAGVRQISTGAIRSLRSLGACSDGCWVWSSITQRSYQTAEILGSLLNLDRSRVVPEYSFLDARGLGALEGDTWENARTVVTRGDALSSDWRPPHGTDGTPNESVADVLVRVRQVMSIMETQYRGRDIIIVSPDSDNLSILQAALVGLDLRRHGEFAMAPGEVRALEVLLDAPPPAFQGKLSCPRPPSCA